mgnify:CR=1 FL=1
MTIFSKYVKIHCIVNFIEVKILVRKLKKTVSNIGPVLIKMADNDFIINFGSETVTIMERYYKGLDLLANDNLEEAELIFKNLVNEVRGYYDSIIALINIFSERGDFPNISKIYNVGVRDLKLILGQLPEDGKIPFTYASNKGFLKFLYKLGVKHLNTSRINDAITNFKLLLKLNPNDEFDVLEVLLQALFEKEEYDEILSLTSDLNNIKNASIIYNRILALLKLNRKDEALAIILELKEDNLKIYKNLDLNKDYAMDISEYISLSVIDDKSQYYWNNFYRYWADDIGSLQFLISNIKNTDNLAKNSINPLETFKHYLEEQDLKEATIKNHLDNLEIFVEVLNEFDLILSKLESISETTSKTNLNKIITSLNKYFSFIIQDKERAKSLKDELKKFKDKI